MCHHVLLKEIPRSATAKPGCAMTSPARLNGHGLGMLKHSSSTDLRHTVLKILEILTFPGGRTVFARRKCTCELGPCPKGHQKQAAGKQAHSPFTKSAKSSICACRAESKGVMDATLTVRFHVRPRVRSASRSQGIPPAWLVKVCHRSIVGSFSLAWWPCFSSMETPEITSDYSRAWNVVSCKQYAKQAATCAQGSGSSTL